MTGTRVSKGGLSIGRERHSLALQGGTMPPRESTRNSPPFLGDCTYACEST